MALTAYQTKILHAFNEVSKENQGEGASAGEVTRYMAKHKMLAELDTVIDIADQLQELADMGHIGQRSGK